MTDPEVIRIAEGLTGAQREAVLWFSPGGFVVGFRPQWAGLSDAGFKGLEAHGLIQSHWTWASTTRPDTGLTPLGLAVRDYLNAQAGKREGGER